MTELVSSLKAVADELRIRILLLLRDEEACVCELMDVFDMPQSKLSHHLIALREAGFLQDERRGKWNYYRISAQMLNAVNSTLLSSLSSWTDASMLNRDKNELKKAKHRIHC